MWLDARSAHCLAPARLAPLRARLQDARPGAEVGYDRVLMTERSAVERELEEIRAQLDWVRDYL